MPSTSIEQTPEAQAFVAAVNRAFVHLQKLLRYLRENLDISQPIPNFDSLSVAHNFKEAHTLLATFLPFKKTGEHFNATPLEHFLMLIGDIDWKKDENHGKRSMEGIAAADKEWYAGLDMNWYKALVAADHDPKTSIYPSYGFREGRHTTPRQTLSQDTYLAWLKEQKKGLWALSAEVQKIQTKAEASVPDNKFMAAWRWCLTNKKFTAPLALLTISFLILFPYPIPIIACIVAFSSIVFAIAKSKTVRTFVEKYQDTLGTIMGLMTLLLWLPILGAVGLSKAVSWLNIPSPTSLDLLPLTTNTISAVYATAVAILGSIGTTITAIWNWRQNRSPVIATRNTISVPTVDAVTHIGTTIATLAPTPALAQAPTPAFTMPPPVGPTHKRPWQPQGPSARATGQSAKSAHGRSHTVALPPPPPPREPPPTTLPDLVAALSNIPT